MAPTRGTKRKSDEGVSSTAAGHVDNAQDAEPQRIATRPGTPPPNADGPSKKQKTGISMNQKQALIDNLQLEITERARKLRAQYSLQAQGLRTRIEIRVNRIPMALRKAKMGELADRYNKNGQPHHPQSSTALSAAPRPTLPPPVPEKDRPPLVRPDSTRSAASHMTASSSHARPGSPAKKTRFVTAHPSQTPFRAHTFSDEIWATGKNNGGEATNLEPPKTKNRAEVVANKASKVLSPASPNVRTITRPGPGGKPATIRPTPLSENAPGAAKSPVKQTSTSSLFSSLAEKARSTPTTASSAAGAGRGRKPGAKSAKETTRGAPTAKTQRRASGTSESSESSTGTVVKKSTAKKSASAKGAGVLSSIRRGVAGAGVTKKTAATKATPASTATGRVLRKRN